MQKGMEKALRPYFELTNAVCIGELELFRSVAEKFSSTFISRISLADVAKKLRLDSANPVADEESIAAKAIRVGALRFPPNSHKEKESTEKRRKRQQQEQELAKHIAEEDDDEF
ncbi:hypothetical protein SLEP1_g30946 [Rubroshorea leprosula]|uniref:26S proteasome non-ATPase regulatory subunit 3 C-terminal domain-containing protein n=1 Tax=Rubroshorea leprosula TaxID=152421 RepID=A0AAV5K1W5_9ROSI|nr:hypothetical protein SLEP1_g30946 [Rubroshorea leprosula]